MIHLASVMAGIAMCEFNKRIEFEDLCASLPPDEADALRSKKREEWRDEKEHQRKLEIARAGRTRNFWGQ